MLFMDVKRYIYIYIYVSIDQPVKFFPGPQTKQIPNKFHINGFHFLLRDANPAAQVKSRGVVEVLSLGYPLLIL